MEKLTPKTIKIKAEILTPIHIDNGEVYDRLDYFIFKRKGIIHDSIKFYLVSRNWLKDLGKKDFNFFKEKIIKNIENGNYIGLERAKEEIVNKKILDIEQYKIEEIYLGEKAKSHLLQKKQYSKNGKNGNNGEIKKFSRFGINKNLIIPGSTLKGLFRTISLMNKISEVNNYNREKKERYLEILDNGSFFIKTFANLLFKDIKLNNYELMIEQIEGKNSSSSKKGIPQILEVINLGEFEIIIKDLKGKITKDNLVKMLNKYSNILISREENILKEINYNNMDFINDLKNILSKGKIPIKIGMYKKSSSYKLFWEDLLNKIGKEAKDGKEWIKLSRKFGIGNKSMNFGEKNKPLGWIALSDIQILDEE